MQPPTLNSIHILHSCKTYTGLLGWIQNFFGRTIRVINKKGERIYFHKQDLLEKLIAEGNVKISKLEQKKLADLMVGVLNPIKGIKLTMKNVKNIFQEFQASFAGNRPSLYDIRQKFKQLKTRHLSILTYQSDELIKHLKLGDIFFKKNSRHSDSLVVKAQKFTAPFLGAKYKEREAFTYSHTAMYVGAGLVTEAVSGMDGGIQLRLIKLEDSRFALTKQNKYLISRSSNQELAASAAKVALKVATLVSPLDQAPSNSNPHKYNFIDAVRSIYHTANFGIAAKWRYFKQYIDFKYNDKPLNFISHQHFFCSNFIGYCYQTAESEKIVPMILEKNDIPLRSKPGIGKAIYHIAWTFFQHWKHVNKLDKIVTMKFDAYWVTPQDLRNFVVGNPHLFTDKFLVVPHL